MPDTHVYFLLAAPEAAVYLVPSAGGWALPQVALPLTAGISFSAPAITAAVAALVGGPVEFLLGLGVTDTHDGAPAEAVVVLSAASAQPSLAGPLEAVPLAEACRAAWARPDHRAALEALAEPPPPKRVAWARPGFLAEAGAWIEEQLAAHGFAATGPLEMKRNWSLSALLRVPTTGGDCYFKAIPALFEQEPALTDHLSRRFPGRVPAVIGYEAGRHWLLMRGFDGAPLGDQAAPEPWLAALRGYAEMQVELVPEAPGLLALGCPDRRALLLEGQVDDVLADTDGMLIDHPYGLSAADAARLQALGPALRQACRAFAALPLPPTLEHGDLHGHNIALTAGGGYLYYDWSDGCLAPPFFGLPAFLETSKADWHAALTVAYTAPWLPYTDAATLARARRLARPLSDLHMALSYVWIRAQTDDRQRWQLAGSLPYFLRELLKHWAEAEAEL